MIKKHDRACTSKVYINKFLFLILFLFLELNVTNPLLAQWTPINGPENAVINCIASAPDGSIFVGTNLGIYLYNGTNWVKADSGMPSPPPNISALGFSNDYSTIFAAPITVNGLYRSTDNGVTWNQPDPNIARITAITADSDGSMIANGEVKYNGRFITGILRTTDNGIHWAPVDSSIDAYIFSVTSGGKIFAATDSGVYSSKDNGQNWAQSGLYNYRAASAFAASPDGSTLIASYSGYAPPSKDTTAVFLSTNGGKGWRQINDGNTNLTSNAVWALSISPDNSLIFAGTYVDGIFLSRDNGKSWLALNDSLSTYDYISAFTFSPDESTVYAATEDAGVWKRPLSELTSVKTSHTYAPEQFTLSQNYPNPFNPSTTISYSLPKSSNIKIEVFNVLGEKVATLVNGYEQAGGHNIQWDAGGFASGIYFYKLSANNLSQIKKMILLK